MNTTPSAQLRRSLHGLKKTDILERSPTYFTELEKKRPKFELIELLVRAEVPFVETESPDPARDLCELCPSLSNFKTRKGSRIVISDTESIHGSDAQFLERNVLIQHPTEVRYIF